MYQFENAAVGPPVYMANPNNTGIPEAKFIDENVAAQFSVKKSEECHRDSASASDTEEPKFAIEFLLVPQLREQEFILSNDSTAYFHVSRMNLRRRSSFLLCIHLVCHDDRVTASSVVLDHSGACNGVQDESTSTAKKEVRKLPCT